MAAKTTGTLNRPNSQLRDSTATILPRGSVLRKGSFHSSSVSLNTMTKGNRDYMSASEIIDNRSKKLVGASKPLFKRRLNLLMRLDLLEHPAPYTCQKILNFDSMRKAL